MVREGSTAVIKREGLGAYRSPPRTTKGEATSPAPSPAQRTKLEHATELAEPVVPASGSGAGTAPTVTGVRQRESPSREEPALRRQRTDEAPNVTDAMEEGAGDEVATAPALVPALAPALTPCACVCACTCDCRVRSLHPPYASGIIPLV